MSEWQSIETYPYEIVPKDDPGGDKWGPEVLVLMPKHKTHCLIKGVPTKEFDVGPTRLIAHLEADMWLSRDPSDPVASIELHLPPSHWQQLPELPDANPIMAIPSFDPEIGGAAQEKPRVRTTIWGL